MYEVSDAEGELSKGKYAVIQEMLRTVYAIFSGSGNEESRYTMNEAIIRAFDGIQTKTLA